MSSWVTLALNHPTNQSEKIECLRVCHIALSRVHIPSLEYHNGDTPNDFPDATRLFIRNTHAYNECAVGQAGDAPTIGHGGQSVHGRLDAMRRHLPPRSLGLRHHGMAGKATEDSAAAGRGEKKGGGEGGREGGCVSGSREGWGCGWVRARKTT